MTRSWGERALRRVCAQDLSDTDVMVIVVEIGAGWTAFGWNIWRRPHPWGAGRCGVGPSSVPVKQVAIWWGETIEFLTGVRARRHGRCGAHNRAMRLLTAAKRESGEAA